MRPIPLAALTLLLAAAQAHAGPSVEECYLDVPSTEGTSAITHSDDGGIRYIEIIQAGEMGRMEFGITPLDGRDAVMLFRLYSYNRPIYAEGPFAATLEEEGRVIVEAGRICEHAACYISTVEKFTRQEVQEMYDQLFAAYPGRGDCFTYYPQ